MGYKSVVAALKTTLAANGFKGNVSVWDYSILDTPRPQCIILRPGPMTTEIDAYGGQWKNSYVVYGELYVYYPAASSEDAANALLTAIDDVRTTLINNFHLGQPATTIEAAMVRGVSRATPIVRGEGSHEWFGVIITFGIDEQQQET